MTRAPRSIDEALRRARVFQGEYTTAELASAWHHLASNLHEPRWVQFLSTAPSGARAHQLPGALHEQAAHDLRTLCRGAVHHHGAARHTTDFDTVRDPDGALTFACLLYLADQEKGAQFWWHYAAGADSTTAALSLYLRHLRQGDMHDAQHWAGQIHRLNLLDWSCYTPVPHHADTSPHPSPGPSVGYALPRSGPAVSEDAVKDAIDELQAPQQRTPGACPPAHPCLADHWDELVTT
ncbi:MULTISPECIES: hypothetical protein [unclassified Streptomyces]|uniref:hypothetical protein n=1 Tax=unclassified Streptomyces TaxID=2593676 RepID=UPI0038201ED2